MRLARDTRSSANNDTLESPFNLENGPKCLHVCSELTGKNEVHEGTSSHMISGHGVGNLRSERDIQRAPEDYSEVECRSIGASTWR